MIKNKNKGEKHEYKNEVVLSLLLVSIAASKVSVATSVFTPVTGTALSFNPLAFNTTDKIWLPAHFFAIDIGPSGGPGTTDVTVTYTEGTNPNTPGHGLGWKSIATFAKITGATTEVALPAHPKKMLKDLAGEHILASELGTSPLRIYLGIATGGTGEPTGVEVISNSDKAGAYNGSLVISATVS